MTYHPGAEQVQCKQHIYLHVQMAPDKWIQIAVVLNVFFFQTIYNTIIWLQECFRKVRSMHKYNTVLFNNPGILDQRCDKWTRKT